MGDQARRGACATCVPSAADAVGAVDEPDVGRGHALLHQACTGAQACATGTVCTHTPRAAAAVRTSTSTTRWSTRAPACAQRCPGLAPDTRNAVARCESRRNRPAPRPAARVHRAHKPRAHHSASHAPPNPAPTTSTSMSSAIGARGGLPWRTGTAHAHAPFRHQRSQTCGKVARRRGRALACSC